MDGSSDQQLKTACYPGKRAEFSSVITQKKLMLLTAWKLDSFWRSVMLLGSRTYTWRETVRKTLAKPTTDQLLSLQLWLFRSRSYWLFCAPGFSDSRIQKRVLSPCAGQEIAYNPLRYRSRYSSLCYCYFEDRQLQQAISEVNFEDHFEASASTMYSCL